MENKVYKEEELEEDVKDEKSARRASWERSNKK